MAVTTKLTVKDYINATLIIMFRRTQVIIFASIISIISLGNILLSAFKSQMIITTLLPPVVTIFIFGFVFRYSLSRAYKNNPRIQETIQYTFTEDKLVMKGESFNADLTWHTIPKVTQTKNWVLIWQSKSIANAIPKKDIAAEDIHDLKKILDRQRVSNNLQANVS
jgi:YcxB-like protein